MTNMDHNEAVRLQAAEKYLLGELPRNSMLRLKSISLIAPRAPRR